MAAKSSPLTPLVAGFVSVSGFEGVGVVPSALGEACFFCADLDSVCVAGLLVTGEADMTAVMILCLGE